MGSLPAAIGRLTELESVAAVPSFSRKATAEMHGGELDNDHFIREAQGSEGEVIQPCFMQC